MASSVASASPPPGHATFHSAESADDTESWQYVPSDPSSVSFIPSPASSGMNSWAMVGYPNHVQTSPSAMSPLHLDSDNRHHGSQPPSIPVSYPDHGADGQFSGGYGDQSLMGGQELVFANPMTGAMDMTSYYPTFQHDDLPGMSSLGAFQMAQSMDLGIPQQFQSGNDVAPWDPTNLKNDDISSIMTMEEINGYMSQSPPKQASAHGSSHSSPSPKIRSESGTRTSPIRRVRGNSKVEKKKPDTASKFVIVTPSLVNQQSGRPNPFECFEALRTTQRGRKGPLANDTKESALMVRRLGACFCCHARKVKCDKERPCKNCKKLTVQVPQIMCWQFADFLPVLFPDFIRGHFKGDQMASFLSENVDTFKVDGMDHGLKVELFSGIRFQSTLLVPASFFTPKTAEILQHWHVNVGVNQMDMESRGAAPIGIDPENPSQREALKRNVREYVQNLTHESLYAEQVTDSIRATQLPRKVLSIVQRFAQKTGSTVVKRALSIYVMHYVLTRQLCLTNKTIVGLQHTNMVPQNNPWVTTRVLNRQVKAVLDEMLLKEMSSLFDNFSKSLKPKSRKEWAPCLAAFLVLCLFMEAVETAADLFVVSQNEVNIRSRSKLEYQRDFALSICKEIDNMPFKQFAYQFHQIYQTYSRDHTTKPYNPLVDGTFERQGDIDAATMELTAGLRELLQGDGWYELDYLVADPILPDQETHPYPRDIALDYTGRLLARFLLSFTDEKYLFDGHF
ncbi:hypothetical protein F5Y15DRAFT_389012 [Xylariaceae sp. FL0016]|nr:hypothetical protein F5Y15DRAFT_389012 [Xylariaceae sp. FL0016]